MKGDPKMRFETLNDISKVAAVKATSSLSKLLEFPIEVDVVPIETKRLTEITSNMQSHQMVVGLSIPVLGILPGTSLLIYPENAAFAICDAMFHRKDGETKEFHDEEISALREVANIVIGNFLSAFAMPLKVDSMLHQAAHFSRQEFGVLIENTAATLSKNIKEGVVVEISFLFKHLKIVGMAIFLFDEESMVRVIEELTS